MSTTSKKQCVTCNKSGGILMCYGCQQTFCGKHVSEHRQQLGGQLDHIMQEHDILRQDLEGESLLKENPLIKEIDLWEKDSIEKIQAAAENARKSIQELIEKFKERVSKACGDITKNLRSAREADDFSENDLSVRKKHLEELRLEITSPSSVKLIDNKSDPIYLIKVETDQSSNNEFADIIDLLAEKNISNPDSNERFLETMHSVKVEEGGYLARHVGFSCTAACVRGRFLYSKGHHFIGFKLVKVKQPYCIFFGCISSKTALHENIFQSPACIGWFGSNQVYEHGHCSSSSQEYGYNSTKFRTNDELYLIISCDSKKIQLVHERLNIAWALSVNPDLVPFPWQYLMVLCNPGDSVRILPNV